MNIHDLISEFEAKIASLFSEFRSMVAAHSSPSSAQSTGQPAPAQPATAEAPTATQPAPTEPAKPSVTDLLYGSNPSAAAAQPAPVDSGLSLTPMPASCTYAQFQQINTALIVGPGSWTVTECPAKVQVLTVMRPSYPAAAEYTLTVNGVSKKITNPNNTCQIDAEGPSLAISVDQPAGDQLTLQLRA